MMRPGRALMTTVPLSVGPDSPVSRQWPRELQLLEYGQRLVQRRRNVAAAPESGEPSTAQPQARRKVGLVTGAPADFLVMDYTVSALAGVTGR